MQVVSSEEYPAMSKENLHTDASKYYKLLSCKLNPLLLVDAEQPQRGLRGSNFSKTRIAA